MLVSSMGRTLLHFIHPALEKSRVNRKLLERAKLVPDVTVSDLYEKYPDFHINGELERELLSGHERVVFQFPMYWYSSPSLLKEWFDHVLAYGWAYGPGADALVGKTAGLVVTAGGAQGAYTSGGHNRYTMEEMLRPIECTLSICGMVWEDPFFVHGALHLEGEAMKQTADAYENWLLET